MDKQDSALKPAAYVALGAMALLLVGALVFYKERMLFADAAYVCFNIVNSGDFFIQERRYGSYITQAFPYLGTLLHLPLKAILIGYSLSFNLFYFSVTSLLVLRWRQYAFGILMALYYFLFVTQSYFWTNNEIHQAVACMCLFWGVMKWLGDRKVHPLLLIPVFTALAALTLYTHLVVIIPFLFLWIYLMFDKGFWPFTKWMTVVLSAILVAIIANKYLTSIGQNYDGPKLKEIPPITFENVVGAFSTPVIKIFLSRLVSIYTPAIIVFLLGMIWLFRTKKLYQGGWVLLSVAGYFALMGLTYGKFDENFALFHIESEWAAMSFLIATPFVFTFLPAIKARTATILVLVIFLIRIGYIATALPGFLWHTRFKEEVLSQMKKKNVTKLALHRNNEISSKLLLDWTLAEESMFLSSMNGDVLRTFRFINTDDTATLRTLKNPVGISTANKWIEQNDVNVRYFLLDTTTKYIVSDYESFMK